MKVRILPMMVEHYLEATAGVPAWGDLATFARSQIDNGPAGAALIDDQLAAVAGVVIAWPGMGEAWAVLTDLGRRHPMVCHRLVARELRAIIRDYRLHRVQADILRSFQAGRIWASRLGFRKEGMMRRYGPDRADFVRYVLLPEPEPR